MTIWRTRIPCSIPKATNTHTEYVILIAFPLQKMVCTNAPQCYVIRTLPVLLTNQFILYLFIGYLLFESSDFYLEQLFFFLRCCQSSSSVISGFYLRILMSLVLCLHLYSSYCLPCSYSFDKLLLYLTLLR